MSDRPWRVGIGAVLTAIGFAFAGVLGQLVNLWATNADYSHGFLIVPFAGYLLWARRDQIPDRVSWPDPWALPFFVAGAGLLVVADRVNIAREWVQAFALAVCLAGVVVMFCGRWKGLRWAAPSLGFLLFAFELPHSVYTTLGLKLRDVATAGGNFTFQLLGLPSYAEGNRIVIGETVLEVAQACSGLSMLLTFFALACAIAAMARTRPWIDRAVIVATAPAIAVLCNVVRIVVTGLVYHAGWTQLGDMAVHDLAGWLMMPLALGLTWLVVRAMDWVIEPVDRLSTGEALGLPTRRAVAGPVP
jgi:exosortase